MSIFSKKSKKKVELISKQNVRTLKKSLPIEKRLSQTTGEIFSNMFRGEDETFEKILVNLLTDDEGLGMKTRIGNPLGLTRLEIIKTWFDIELGDGSKSAKVLDAFGHLFRVNKVSEDGKSREETIRALTEGLKEERTITDKLSKPPE